MSNSDLPTGLQTLTDLDAFLVSLCDELEQGARNAESAARWLRVHYVRISDTAAQMKAEALLKELGLAAQEVRGAELRVAGFAGPDAPLTLAQAKFQSDDSAGPRG